MPKLDDAIACMKECARDRDRIVARRMRAGAAVVEELRNGSRCVAILNALLRPALRKKSGLLTKWNSAKRVSVVTIAEASDEAEHTGGAPIAA